ncbi:MAG: META domain-containing protein [Anaerolineae bacterium]|nr:META domain-containing protein [Anaerolineae bacterium]
MNKATVRVTLLLMLALTLGLAACQPMAAPTPPAPSAPQAPEAPSAQTPTPMVAAPAAGPARSLAGTSWLLVTLNGERALADVNVTLEFGRDGEVFGNDGCNAFRGTYVQQGDRLSFPTPLAGTLKACEPEVEAQAAAFREALGRVTGFTASPRQLVLFAGDDIVAVFIAAPTDLTDTVWEVISYNNGQGAVVTLIVGTEATVEFGVGGLLSGNAGCNQFAGEYAAADGAIQIFQLASTARLCPMPEGLMEQEQAFLAALRSAATYRTDGDTLELRTADDQIAVTMARKEVVDLPAPEPTPAVPRGRVVGAQALNVRSGPGTVYPVIAVAREGDEGEIVGRSADGRWWAVKAPSLPGGIAWVSADFVLATNAENVPVIPAPPTPTPQPTPTRLPPTPTPVPPPPPQAQIAFWADRTNINQGECATLSWSVQNVRAVWMYPQGQPFQQFPRTGQGSEVVCPPNTTTYELRVELVTGQVEFRQITINVNVPPPPPPPPPPSDPLRGTGWMVVNLSAGGAIVTLVPGTNITMVFSQDGRISGNAGCNSYNGTYLVGGGNSISFGALGASMQMCANPPGVMEQEALFLSLLRQVNSFEVTDGGQTLMLKSGGQVLVVLKRAFMPA